MREIHHPNDSIVLSHSKEPLLQDLPNHATRDDYRVGNNRVPVHQVHQTDEPYDPLDFVGRHRDRVDFRFQEPDHSQVPVWRHRGHLDDLIAGEPAAGWSVQALAWFIIPGEVPVWLLWAE